MRCVRVSMSLLALIALLAGILLPGRAGALNTCNGVIQLEYVSGANFPQPVPPGMSGDDVIRVRLHLGAGIINGGTQLRLNEVMFDLDCLAGTTGTTSACTDDGMVVQYEGDGTLTTTCGGAGFSWSSGHAVSASPNEIAFMPSSTLVLPANNTDVCSLEFNIRVVGRTSNADGFIRQNAFFAASSCNNTPPVQASAAGSGAFPECQVCSDTVCNTGSCDSSTGNCVQTPVQDSTPCPDTDGNNCTTAGCEAGACVQTHQQKTCTTDQCNLGCAPATGQCAPASPSTPCTAADPVQCKLAGCELDPADATHGVCVATHFNAADSTPCSDTDNNLCTTAGCEGGACVQTHQQNTSCTVDQCNVGCSPTTGQCTPKAPSTPCTAANPVDCKLAGCELSPSDSTVGLCVATHANAPDSTPCSDTDASRCTTAGCEAGVCVQTHAQTTCDEDGPCGAQTCNPQTGMCEIVPGTATGFTFLVKTHGKLGNGSQVFGNVGANDVGGLIQLGKDGFVADGFTIAGDNVNLLANDDVFNLQANQLHLGPGVRIRGTKGTPVLPLTNPFCPIPNIDCTGGLNQVIQPFAIVTLPPGTYGSVLVRSAGTLVLSPAGTFTFCSLSTARNATIDVAGASQSTINIKGDFRLADQATFLPRGTTPTPSVNIAGTLRISRRSTIQAFISAPNAEASFGRGASITGSVCVLANRADKGITMMCPAPRAVGSGR